jgi:hypothetical protein
MNILRLDLSGSQLQKNSTRICMRSHYSICTKPHLNPSQRRKSGSERRKRNQTNQTNVERRNKPTHPRATGKRSSRTTAKPWQVFPKLRSISTKQIRHPADTVDITATIP